MSTPARAMPDPVEDFARAIADAGIDPPEVIHADGCLHRFTTNGKQGDDAGFYVLYLDGIPAGAFGDWRSGVTESWCARRLDTLTPTEREEHQGRIEAARREAASERARAQEEAATRAAELWARAKPETGEHRYLRDKHVQAHGIRTNGERLLIPMRDAEGKPWNLQRVAPDGTKRFLPGGRTKGLYFGIGRPDGVLVIAEGFATAASIHEATGHAVAVAFSAGNLRAVAEVLRKKLGPGVRLIIAGDNDANGTGQKAATEAACAVGGLVAIPKTPGKDWNDIARAEGLEAVCKEIAAARAPDPAPEPAAADHAPDGVSRKRVTILSADGIQPEPIRWFWPGWLARGKLHILAGRAGTGKTTLALDWAASVSGGRAFPDGYRPTPGCVMIWSGEDSPSDTLVPRLMAAGADLARVSFIDAVEGPDGQRPFDPAHDVALLADACARMPEPPAFLIVDPLVMGISGDSHKNAEVRRGLYPLVALAKQLDAVLLGISHFSKGTNGRDPLERVTGSLAFGAMARIVFGTVHQEQMDDDAPRRYTLARCKSNIGPDGGGYSYAMEPAEPIHGVSTCRIAWGQAVEGQAKDLLAEAEPDTGGRTKRDEAAGWLRDLLADGLMAVNEVKAQAEDAGYAWRTVQRAKDALGIKPTKTGFDGGWEWSLPPKVAKMPEGSHPPGVDTFGGSGHLGGNITPPATTPCTAGDHLEPAATAPGLDREGAEI